MEIPDYVYQISKIFSLVSIGLELLTAVILAVAMLSRDFNTKTAAARDFFEAATRVRNTALCLLIFLFLIASEGVRIGEMSALSAISSVCKTFAFLSVLVFISSIVLSIIAAIKGIKFSDMSDMKDLIKHMGNSSMWSMILGFLLAYFLYIP